MVENFLKIIFWAVLTLIFIAYPGYPLLLIIFSKIYSVKTVKEEIYPSVTLIISAYNEETTIKKKIQNSLNLDYPSDKLEIIVASDCSTDRTDEIVKEFKTAGVKLISFKQRKGKTAVQNEAVKEAQGEIVLFSDATTLYKYDLVKKIVRNFCNDNVGCVGGELVYVNSDGSVTGEGNGFYWKYEKYIKRLESSITSLIGVSGCCYAVRKKIYEPLREDLISDFLIAQKIFVKSYKAVYEPEAVSYEETNSDSKDEFRMRVRVAVRTLNGLWNSRKLLNPFKYGFYSVQLFIHKILRYSAPVFMLLLVPVNFLLISTAGSIIFLSAFYLQLMFYAFALAGAAGLKSKFFTVPYYFCLTNAALLIGFLKFIKGERSVLWAPIREKTDERLNT